MAAGKFIAYYRVSTAKQERSGLGLESQRASVAAYLNGGEWQLVEEFTEVETGKGANALERRPQLSAALQACKKYGASLLVAKLDRLARNVHFVSGLIESGVDFVAADMPQANKTMIQMHAVMGEWERDAISARTKAALAAAKGRGVKLGVAGPMNLRPSIEARQQAANDHAEKLRSVLLGFQQQGLTKAAMVDQLNGLGIPAPAGGAWHRTTLARVLARLI